ncbi:MAG TPA: FAD/NAD(P)-binding protein [Marmoricola sp.]|nr:FAD/NAD(P)-binding protein [Marmoricola sp.]
MLTDEAPTPLRVVIVGGGAAGAIAAVHLLRSATPTRPLEVRIVERGPSYGSGLAYRTVHPLHTLNNFAGRLSAVEGDPDHLLRWCDQRGIAATPTSFLQRAVYGRYLRETLDSVAVPRGCALHRSHGTVVDVTDDVRGHTVRLADGQSFAADAVVLALGNPPPRRQPRFEHLAPRYVADPWAADLRELVPARSEVLVVGTGLTMVDVAAQFRRDSPGTRVTAVSRSGLLPEVHRPATSRLHDIFDPGSPSSLDDLVAGVRARIRELQAGDGDWRDVVDSLRACANRQWQALTPQDQDRFVADVARRWETARHRMAPDVATHVRAMQRSGALRVARLDEVDLDGFDVVVNCTGPTPVPTPGWNPLVDALLARGTIRPHRLGLGLDVDRDGRVVDGSGAVRPSLHVLGAARRGTEWEVAAIPDLRAQSARLADLLAAEPRGEGTPAQVALSG